MEMLDYNKMYDEKELINRNIEYIIKMINSTNII